MMLRWFRMVYHWFFGGTLFCAPVLMTLYYFQSKLLVEDAESRAALGMKRVTIAAANSPWVFWVVVVEMWLLSIWLVYLLGRVVASLPGVTRVVTWTIYWLSSTAPCFDRCKITWCEKWCQSNPLLLGRETKAYTRLCWKLSPAKVGIKSHAVVVNDIPMLTTEPVPKVGAVQV
jgi:hypothetical protein